ncbi:unnamed protein product [Cylicocyclus nassatus]|uniref:Apple domain-containing protein n=1 Tax=Cylicocyclus nassatus TaxID=53992 RepID=A0AA36M6A9_CYLNA|nr:unnamed protein product [Cylicocyclus nassatus]
MKWLLLFLICIQAKCISSCVFDKVEEMRGNIYDITRGDVNQCLARCYENKDCTGILYEKVGNQCNLIREVQESIPLSCTDEAVCYILQRDEVDSMCQNYLNI